MLEPNATFLVVMGKDEDVVELEVEGVSTLLDLITYELSAGEVNFKISLSPYLRATPLN